MVITGATCFLCPLQHEMDDIVDSALLNFGQTDLNHLFKTCSSMSLCQKSKCSVNIAG